MSTRMFVSVLLSVLATSTYIIFGEPIWLLWAAMMAAADNIYTTVIHRDGDKQEYTAFTVAALGAVMFLPAPDSLLAMLVGSAASCMSQTQIVLWPRRLFNWFSYSCSSIALVMTYQLAHHALGGAPWPSIAAFLALIPGLLAFDGVNVFLFWRAAQKDMSIRQVWRGWIRSLWFPLGSGAVALFLGTLVAVNPLWIAAMLGCLVLLARPQYDLRKKAVSA